MNQSTAMTVNPVTARLTIILCVLGAFCEGLDLQAAGMSAAGVAMEFAPTPQQMGQYFGASTLGLFIGALLGGGLSDRVGRKQVLVVSIAMFGLFTIVTALANTMAGLTQARFLTGLGLGGALPNLLALVAENSSEDKRLSNITLTYAGTPFGGAAISAVALFLEPTQWRVLYWVGGIVPLIVAVIMAFKLPESEDYQRTRASNQQRASLHEVIGEGRAARSILLWVSFFLALLTLYLLLNWLPTLMGESGLSKTETALGQIGFNIGGAVATVFIGGLIAGNKRMATVIATYLGVPVLLFALAHAGTNVTATIVVVFLLGVVVVCSQAVLYATAPTLYPTLIRATGVGAAVAIGRIGSIVGPSLGGVLKGMGYSTAQLLMSLVPVAIVGGITAIVLAFITKPKQ